MANDARSLPPATVDFYRETMRVLKKAEVPFLVTGAYAMGRYTGLDRHTKDLDLFLREEDLGAALEALAGLSDRVERDFAHWIAKAYRGDDTIDLIYRSDNGVLVVDASWFEGAPRDEVLGVDVAMCRVEELLWAKAFVMERERYDGADVAHLLRAHGAELDWSRLIERFDPHWRLLLSHLVLFQFIYPSERGIIPDPVMNELISRLKAEDEPEEDCNLCRGTLLSRLEYRADVEKGSYRDARLPPHGTLSPGDVQAWRKAGERERQERQENG